MHSQLFEYFRKAPFIRLTIPVIAGIVLFLHRPNLFSIQSIYIICSIVFALLIFSHYLSSKYVFRSLFGIVLNALLMLAGYALSKDKQSEIGLLNTKKNIYAVELIEEPEPKPNSIKAIANVHLKNVYNKPETATGKVLLYFQNDSAAKSLLLGDRLLVEIQPQEVKHSGNPEAFNYEKFLYYKQIARQAYVKSGSWQKLDNRAFVVEEYSTKLRNAAIETFKKAGITDDNLAVLSALTLGYKDLLDEKTKKSYSASGAMHVLAVSGLHVGVIFIILNYLLFFIPKTGRFKILKPIVLILTLWAYAFLTGMSPSVMRAALMFSIVEIGNNLNRKTNIYNSLAASAFILLIINPFMLKEVGFQLSYLAVIGIVYFQPKIYLLINFKHNILDRLWAITTVAIAAQIATGPISVYYFNSFPNYFLLSNPVVILAASVIIYSAFLLLIFNLVPYLSDAIAYILKNTVAISNSYTCIIEQAPGSVSKNIYLSEFSLMLLYFIILGLMVFIQQKKYRQLLIVGIFIFFFIANIAFENYRSSKENYLVIYNIRKYSAYNIIIGKTNLLLHSIPKEEYQSTIDFNIRNFWTKQNLDKVTAINFFENNSDSYKEKNRLASNIYIHNEFIFTNYFSLYLPQETNYATDKPIEIDYVVISDKTKTKISDIVKYIKPKQIIIDSSLKKYNKLKIINQCNLHGIKYYDIENKGAFVQYL